MAVCVAVTPRFEKRGNPSFLLPEVLRELYLGRRTGLLHVMRDRESVSFRFVNGEVVSGSSTSERGRLGETMVRNGLLSREDLDRALVVVRRDGRRLGPVLCEMGVIESVRLEEALGLHIKEMLVTALESEEAVHVFEDQELPDLPSEDLTLRHLTGELVLEVTRRLCNAALVRQGLGDVDRVLVPVPEPPFRIDRITLTPSEGYVLSRVDRATTARMIIEITPLPLENVERSLLGLLCTGVVQYQEKLERRTPARSQFADDRQVRPVPQPPARPRQVSEDDRRAVEQIHERLETRDHFQILGLPRSASDGEVKQAYVQLTKRFHPDAHPGASAELAAKIQRVFVRMTEAYRVLSSPEGRAQHADTPKRTAPRETLVPASAPGGPRPVAAAPVGTPSARPPVPASTDSDAEASKPKTASDAVEAAESDVAEGRPWAALNILEPLLPELQGILERRARLLLARAYLMNPDSARKAEAEYLRLMQLDATDVETPLALARFYKDRGLVARARAMFERVLLVQPGHKAALAELPPPGSTSEHSEPASLLGKLMRH